MKIAINISWMMPGQTGGMEWYVRNLIDQLAVIDADNQYLLITGHMNHASFTPPAANFKKIIYISTKNQPEAYQYRAGTANQAQFEQILQRHHENLKDQPDVYDDFSILFQTEKPDIWFCPLIFAVPPDVDIPLVITIPDLQHEHFPQFFSDHDLAIRAMAYPYGARAATAIIGISDFTAQEIQTFYKPDPKRVFAIPLALDDREKLTPDVAQQSADQVRATYDLPNEFLYFPANGWIHKNHEKLIHALAILNETYPIQLIMTGSEFDLFNRIQPLIDQYHLKDKVRHLGYVKRHEIPGLFAAATALVFPSLFEGFGLPVLEAMALGTPVACSRIGSLPDLAGDTVSYFDPTSEQDIAQTILALLKNKTLRQNRAEAGIQRAATFSYQHTAKLTLEVFNKIKCKELVPPPHEKLRPLSWNKHLYNDTCRFCFRCPEMDGIQIAISSPIRGALTITLNNEKLLLKSLRRGRRHLIALKPKVPAPDHYYTFELTWKKTGLQFPWHKPPRLLQLIAIDKKGNQRILIS